MKLGMAPNTGCERSSEVATAARSGAWTSELRSHLAGCADCADTVLLAEAFAAEPAPSFAMADPGLLWWKAELRRRYAAQEKAAAPLRWAESTVAAVALAGAAYLMATAPHLELGPWLLAGAALLSLGAAGSWLLLAGSRK